MNILYCINCHTIDYNDESEETVLAELHLCYRCLPVRQTGPKVNLLSECRGLTLYDMVRRAYFALQEIDSGQRTA